MKRFLKKNAIVHLASAMWKMTAGSRPTVVLYVSMAALAVLIGLSSHMILAELMNVVQEHGGDELVENTGLLLIAFIAVGVVFWGLHGPSRYMETVIAFKVKQALQSKLFRKVTKLPMRWHQEHHSGRTIDQIKKATDALSAFTESGFEVIHVLTRFFGAVAVLTWLMPIGGLVAASAGIVAITLVVIFDKRLIKQYEQLNSDFNGVAADVQDYLTNVSTVVSLRLEDRVSSELHERMGKILPLWRKNSILNELKWFTTARVIEFTQAIILFGYVVLQVRADSVIEIGTMYALHAYLRSIGDSFFQFTYMYGELVKRSTYVHAVDHIEESFDELVRPSEHARLPADWCTLHIAGLGFTYESEQDGGRVAGVQDIDLVLERGKSYALVGASGSGKSTVLSLIRGIHTPQKGRVFSDGEELAFGMAHVAHQTTLIPQEPEIFSKTIEFNVTLGIEASREDLMRSMNLACFTPVLAQLPQGLQTDIAEKGISLSGGQKQRLALARGLFFVEESGSDIILLDEPTSSVDPVTERQIYENVLRHHRDRCVLSAIHKLNLLPMFDEILVFSDGKIVERGTLEELSRRNGQLSHMFAGFGQANAI